MQITVRDILIWLEQAAPPSLAEEWDNVGLLVGDPDEPVGRVLVSLDPSPAVIAQAAGMGVQLLVSHHPVIFGGRKRLLAGDPAYELARAGLSAIAMHTNLDAAAGGVNDVLAARLGLEGIRTAPDGISRVGRLPAPFPPAAFAAYAMDRLEAPAVQWKAGDRPVEMVALCSGAGEDFMAPLLEGADAFLTGELKYHDWPDTAATVVAAGHFHTEVWVAEALAARLREAFPALQVETAKECCPYGVMVRRGQPAENGKDR